MEKILIECIAQRIGGENSLSRETGEMNYKLKKGRKRVAL